MRVQGFFYDIQILFSQWEISANISCASNFLVQNWLHVTEPGVSGPLVLFIWPRSQIGCKADGRTAIWHFKSYQYTNELAKLQKRRDASKHDCHQASPSPKSDRTDCYLQKASFSPIIQSWFLYIRISEFNILSFACGHQNLADCPCAKNTVIEATRSRNYSPNR